MTSRISCEKARLSPGMQRASLLATLFLLFVARINLSVGKCNEFLDSASEIGHMQPDEDVQVEETTTLELYCSLLAGYREKNNLDAKAIFWQRTRTHDTDEGAYIYDEFSALQEDPRFKNEALNDSTAKMILHNSTIKDSGQYKCLVNASSDEKHGSMVCSVTVTVGGPPKKYKDFECRSIDHKNLTCTFSRDDAYYGRSVTKFDVSYHMALAAGVIQERNCTNFSRSERGSNYSCFIGHSKEQREGCSNLSCPPSFMNQNELVFTIKGTNPQGTRTWTEQINPRDKILLSKPREVNASALDSHSCAVSWQISPELRTSVILTEIGVVDQVRYRKVGSDDGWTDATTRETREKRIRLEQLDAYATYEIQVRSRMANNDFWSDYSQTTCTTPACAPEGPPGIVQGAFEQISYGDDRKVTLYWKGVPKNKRNGRDFGYQVYTWLDGKPSDDKILQDTYNPSFSNIELRIPSKTAVNVEIVPYNEIGSVPPQMIERVQIPAVEISPLVVKDIRVVNVSATQLELSWSSSQKAAAFDLFFCPTFLEPHLVWCKDTMLHRNLSGDTFSYNFTRENGTYHRFALAAREHVSGGPAGFREIFSGMTWAVRFCSPGENRGRLDGLSVTALPNATVEIRWAEPCEERFMKIPGYQVNYYPCDINTDCVADKMVRTNETSVILSDLNANSRYCFVVEVLPNNASNITFEPIKQCVLTTAVDVGFPTGPVIGGVCAGAIFLALLIVGLWRGIRRMQKDFKEIQRESRKIIIPAAKIDKYEDEFDPQGTAYYSRIDYGEKQKSYSRQLSDNSGSSSGHGSLSSDFTVKSSGTTTADDAHLIVPDKRDVNQAADRRPVPIVKKHRHRLSHVDLSSARQALQRDSDAAETVSLGRSSYGYANRPSKLESLSHIKLNLIKPPRRPSSLVRVISETESTTVPVDSGLSGASEEPAASFGYVPPSSLQANASSGSSTGNSGGTGYVSHPFTAHDTSGATAEVTGDMEMEHPIHRKNTGKLFVNTSTNMVENDDTRSKFLDQFDNRSPVSSGQSSPVIPTTRLLSPPHFAKEETSNGYVKWP